eukprot:TRINITY_DN4784_c1_g1_i1.p1 TRINITY_DN4784_c1_g1~~TRINITY_DN4784_c1_g1_i1.p1  ORF type:complete len:448 (-),score=94.56 TRINITY_DN4784_c1_g1_i1:43-1353(-)
MIQAPAVHGSVQGLLGVPPGRPCGEHSWSRWLKGASTATGGLVTILKLTTGRLPRRGGGPLLPRARAIQLLASTTPPDPAATSQVMPMSDQPVTDMTMVQLGATGVKSTWPPKQNEAHRSDISPVLAELSMGGKSGFADQFQNWPFYQAAISEVQVLSPEDAELKPYKIIDFTKELDRAFALAMRWEKANFGRSANFSGDGAGNLSSVKVTNPILMRQIQGLGVFEKWCLQPGHDATKLDEFLESYEASEDTCKEFREVAPVGQEVFVTALMGSTQGSALSVWNLDSVTNTARIHFCLGHDCLQAGPVAEQALLRLIAGIAKEKGAEQLRCRVRFTEQGYVLPPSSLDCLTPEPGIEAFEVVGVDWVDAVTPDLKRERKNQKPLEDIPEAVHGLKTWLMMICIEDHLEVVEAREDLAEALDLTENQRQALLARSHA